MPVHNRIAEFHAEMAGWRRHLHTNPELSYRESSATPANGIVTDHPDHGRQLPASEPATHPDGTNSRN